jgi:hypothetical protein
MDAADDQGTREFREFLGPLASQYTEGQLVDLRRDIWVLVKILLDLCLKKDQRSREA